MRVAQRTLAGCGGPKVGVSTPGFGDPRVGVSTPGFGNPIVGVSTSGFGDTRVGVSTPDVTVSFLLCKRVAETNAWRNIASEDALMVLNLARSPSVCFLISPNPVAVLAAWVHLGETVVSTQSD